jgi:hypothetical protein
MVTQETDTKTILGGLKSEKTVEGQMVLGCPFHCGD